MEREDRHFQAVEYTSPTTMGSPLFELLKPYFRTEERPSSVAPRAEDPITSRYLGRLSTLQLHALDSTEPQSLAQSSHSTLLSIQALSSRSSRSLINSAEELKTLEDALPNLAQDTEHLSEAIAHLDKSTLDFSEKYSRASGNEVLERRKKALLMSRNADRLGDVLDLPTLLTSAINSATAQGAAGNANYATALDLHMHIKRLHLLYTDSTLLKSIYLQAEDAMKDMASSLVTTLKAQNIKLAGGMRTVGWLRRITPFLADTASQPAASTSEGSFGALFLVCRLSNLLTMLDALEPLRELADQETQRRSVEGGKDAPGNTWAGGQQTERYLKRYVEIFREQSFSIISMFRSIFPTGDAATTENISVQFKTLGLKTSLTEQRESGSSSSTNTLPTALTTFPAHLVSLLTETLRVYLPNVRDKSSRESLLTQILYCAGSLGRLGGDFGMILAFLDEASEEDADEPQQTPEWVAAMAKHKHLAGKLESFAGSTGTTRSLKT